jgi:hypothetical protein
MHSLILHLFDNGLFIDRRVRALSQSQRDDILTVSGCQSANVTEAIYWLYHSLSDYPKKCLHCGKPSKYFAGFNKGYTRDYCSSSCSNSDQSVLAKKKLASLAKYGTEFPWQSLKIKQKIADKQAARNEVKRDEVLAEVVKQGFSLISWDESKFSNPAILCCPKKHEFSRQLEGWSRWVITCPKCSLTRSTGEVALETYIESLGFKPAESGKRKPLGGLELDIWLPEQKIAVEFNGVYFHSSSSVNDKSNQLRHAIKQDAAEAAGIRLIQVFETEWLNQQDIVKSRLAHILGQTPSKIYARKCKIVEVDGSASAEFLRANHIQGTCASSIKYGLEHGGILVALMTFGKPRFNKQHEWELLRYCSALNTTVVGGANKLLSHFKKTKSPTSILSYADRRWSAGGLYQALGFTKLKPSAPGYFYVMGGAIYHRMQFQKHKLAKLLPTFDASLSEEANMLANGYRIMWDCGHHVFSWHV